MYFCFKCDESFGTINILLVHLKYSHMLNSESLVIYKCMQSKCPQSFSNLKSFTYHLKNSHADVSKDTGNDNLKNQFNAQRSVPNISKVVEFEKIEKISISQAKKNIYRESLLFVTKLNSYSHMTNAQIEQILNDITENLHNIFDMIKNVIVPEINSSTKKIEISALLEVCKDPFKNVKTEYKLIKSLKDKNLMQSLEKFPIEKEVQETMRAGISRLEEVELGGTIMPIEFQMKKTFELPNVLSDTIKFMQEVDKSKSEHINNFIQGDIWKAKLNQLHLPIGEIAIPYFLYYDDVEVNDPIGNHTGVQTVAAFYYNFPTFPAHKLSKLENIFPAMFMKTALLRRNGSNACLYKLIDVLKKLEIHGVLIKANTYEAPLRVHFVLGLIIGDNKAVNDICNFSKSFSHNYFCRFCIAHKTQTYEMVYDDKSLIRTKENYKTHVSLDNYRQTGIFSDSLFNTLPSFHVTENFSVDVMHDTFEGIIKYGLIDVLKYFTENKIFDLATFNYRLRNFNYGQIEFRNRCEEIKADHIKKGKLHLSARECYTLLHFFTCLTGDLVKSGNVVWNYVLALEKLVDFLLLDSYSNSDIENLKFLIQRHHELYIQIFDNKLKPKHHIITHYCNIIRNSGPIRYLWCMRFESKNREMKNYTNVTGSRKNLSLSIAKKYSMKFSNFLLTNSEITMSCTKKYLPEHLNKKNYFQQLTSKLTSVNNIKVLASFYFNGTEYKRNYCLFKNHMFFKIVDILDFPDEGVQLVLLQHNIEFSDHYNCYFINSAYKDFSFRNINEFKNKPFLPNTLFDGKQCFKIRYL